MKDKILRVRILLVALICFCLAVQADAQAQRRAAPLSQTPESLCRCAANDSVSRGGLRTFEEFLIKYGNSFKSPTEAQLAWRVYQAANQCDAVVIIGRLSDTGSFENKPGYCVLRTLKGWTMAVNEAFIHGGTDRGARFALTSEMPTETMGNDVDISQVEKDRNTHWRVIYNREIKWVLDTGRYQLAYDKNRKITPTNLAGLNPTDYKASAGRAPVNKPQAAHRWVLESVTVSPEIPPQGWTYSAQSSSANYVIYNGDKADFQWTPPPQQVDSNGFTVSLSVQARPTPMIMGNALADTSEGTLLTSEIG